MQWNPTVLAPYAYHATCSEGIPHAARRTLQAMEVEEAVLGKGRYIANAFLGRHEAGEVRKMQHSRHCRLRTVRLSELLDEISHSSCVIRSKSAGSAAECLVYVGMRVPNGQD